MYIYMYVHACVFVLGMGGITYLLTWYSMILILNSCGIVIYDEIVHNIITCGIKNHAQ